MAILTNKQLVAECEKMAGIGSGLEKSKSKIDYYKNRFGYVLGAQGHLYTETLARQWGAAKRAKKSLSYFIKTCAHWFGWRVVDCSGLIVEAYRKYDADFGDKSANYFYNSYTTERGAIKTMPEIPGVIVWKSGHIGVYQGGGKVIEARGKDYGVVVSDLSTQPWKKWGKLKDVAYSTEKAVQVDKPVFTRLLKYTSPYMRGDDVKAFQTLLTKAGQKPGAIDGIFGKNTRDAAKSFQRANNLTVTGYANKATVTALGGVWAEAWTVSRVLYRKNPLMSGDDVLALKKALVSAGYLKAATKKTFGDDTDKAVRAFQKAKGLKEDGQAGEKTVTALGGTWKK